MLTRKNDHTMKTSLRIFLALFLLPLFSLTAAAQEGSTGEIKVTVLDEKKQPMPGAIVRITAGGPSTGGATDLNGNYTFRAMSAGTYDVEARMTNYKRYTKTGVQVTAGQTAYAEFAMQLIINEDSVVVIKAVRGPVDPTYSTFKSLDAKAVKASPNRNNMVSLVTGTCSSCSEGAGGQLVMRGSREGASAVYVDGEKMYGRSGVPAGSIDGVTILSGGIPASFGDMTGGIVIITTKSYYSGMAAKENMYYAAAEEREAAQEAADEASGKRKETGDEIIENEAADSTKAPAPAPAPAPGGEQAPAGEQPAPQQPAPQAPAKAGDEK